MMDAMVTGRVKDEFDGMTQAGNDLAQFGHGLIVGPSGIDEG